MCGQLLTLRSRRTIRFTAWILSAAGLFAGSLLWFNLLRGSRILHSDPLLIGGQAGLGLLCIALFALLKTTPSDALRLPPRWSVGLILAGAAVLQLAALMLFWPALSDDLIRYRLDGRMWISGVSPYATPPRDWAQAAPQASIDGIDHLVPHQEIRSIYPPTAQAVFVLGAEIEKATLGDMPVAGHASPDGVGAWRERLFSLPPGRRIFFLRAQFALLAVVATAQLLALLRATNRSPWWAVLFAWNPLVVPETGGMGHIDILAIVLLLAMLLAIQRKHFGRAGIALALAAGVKPFALLLLPFLWRAARDSRRSAHRTHWRLLLAVAVTLSFLFVPALIYQRGYAGYFQTNRMVSRSWEANGSIYEVFKNTLGHGVDGVVMDRTKDAARLAGLLVLIATAGLLWQARATLAEAGYWLFLVMLLVWPVAYPWYLIWPLCFVPLLNERGGWCALVWAATVAVSYRVWNLPDWALPERYALVEYLPVFATLTVELFLLARLGPLARAQAARSLHPAP